MPKIPANELSNKLLEKRISLDISQREMAKKVGVSYPVYAGLERGTYKMSLKLLRKVATFLDISMKEALELYE